MFKPFRGDCSQCDRKGVIIPVKSGLCQYCNHELKQAKKKSEGKETKKKTYVKKPTGEVELFRQIYEERDPWCEWCGNPISEFSVANYHHTKPKSKFPELRLDKNNIVKICFECHFNEHNNVKK